MIRFVLHPGPVAGRYGENRRFISGSALAALYGVEPHECTVAPSTELEWATWVEPVGATHLRPRHDGHYQLPTEERK